MSKPVEDGYPQLVYSMLVQAMDDLQDTDPIRAVDALAWWLGEDPALMMLAGWGMNIDPVDALQVVLVRDGKSKDKLLAG